MDDIDYPYEWTSEDIRTCDALVRSGHLDYEEPVTVLRIVEAARAFERNRIVETLDRQPPWTRAAVTDVLLWVDNGAPDVEDIREGIRGARQ